MKKILSILTMSLLAPAFVLASVNATSGTIDASVAPGATVNGTVSVTLSNGDDWHATKVEVSIPGPNNDIDVCLNTADADTNGSHVRPFSFTAPATDGNYVAEITAYENGNCTGESDDVSKNFSVVTPPPPADTDGDGEPDTTDNCVNDANPAQEDADTDGEGDACDATPNGNPSPDPTPSAPAQSSYGGGGGMCHPNTGWPECQGAANYRFHNLPLPGNIEANAHAQLKMSLMQKALAILQQMIAIIEAGRTN